MGDAFPASVEWFFEFAQKAADLNALLQGLLGRACGYGKRSTVVMSQDNMDILREYVGADGRYTYKTSRHSKVFGYRRGAPTSLLRIRAGWDDPTVRAFFERLENEIVKPLVKTGTKKLSAQRAPSGDFRKGPLLRIAEETGLFAYLERQDVRERLLPNYPEFHIARAGDLVRKNASSDEFIGYQMDDQGNCRFTFRAISLTGTHGGLRSRGLGQADAADRAKAGGKLEPQINMEKFDPATGAKLEDPEAFGNWRAVMITVPLLEPVQELKAGDVAYPVQESPFSALMTDEEKETAGYFDDEPALDDV